MSTTRLRTVPSWAVDHLDHDARARDGEFVAFAAHVFDQDAKVQFAAAETWNLSGSSVSSTLSATLFRFAEQALADLAAGKNLPPGRRTANC